MTASVRGASIALLLALAAPFVSGQVLYKWTDPSGKVVYSDRLPPKGFQGTVTPIEPDPLPSPAVVPREVSAAPAKRAEPAPDMAARRRETREALEARVATAREGVEAARKALEDAQSPGDDDRRTIQRRVDPTASTTATQVPATVDAATNAVLGGPPAGPMPKGGCNSFKNVSGTETTICARSVLGEAYYERIAQLEDALKKAEEALDAALVAYRRGVD